MAMDVVEGRIEGGERQYPEVEPAPGVGVGVGVGIEHAGGVKTAPFRGDRA
jgi:hypothetical protein